MNRYGFTEAQWEEVKTEGKAVLAGYAKRRQMVPYSEFVKQIHSIQLEHHDPRLFHLLGEISSEESVAGRGMLSALVVHKHGDYQPGPGFFDQSDADSCSAGASDRARDPPGPALNWTAHTPKS